MCVSHLTTPDVFLRTEAAKLCVTPTRLVPSTSTIWSFTLILTNTHTHTHKRKVNTLHNNPLCKFHCLGCSLEKFKTKCCYDSTCTRDKLAYHPSSHYFPNYTHNKKCQTVLWSQISTVVAPDYYLTERQKRWGSKQTRRANEDMASSSLGHNTAGISALVTLGGQLSSGPEIKVMLIHYSAQGWTVWTQKCTR